MHCLVKQTENKASKKIIQNHVVLAKGLHFNANIDKQD
jgi:hypothetical protein